jgi:hypothetical protein
METNDTIHVLYNACCGKWRPSEKAIQLYNQQYNQEMKKTYPNYKPKIEPNSELGIYSSCRHDPMLLNIFYELREGFDGQNSITKVKILPRKYANHYYITENNGLEKVNLDIDQLYTKNKLYEILNSGMTNDEKISELNKLFFID